MGKKKNNKEKSDIELLREVIDAMELDVQFSDSGEFVSMQIDMDKFDIKAYQRNRSGGGHNYDPLSTYKKELSKKLNPEILKHIPLPLEGYCYISIQRYLTLPKSASKVKRDLAAKQQYLPTKKPDNDNIEKLIFDLFNGIIYIDDAQIVRNVTEKFYGEDHRTIINIKIYKREFDTKRGKKS
jgi:Holliday junction resolvase RusA-like endonuclease